VRTFILSAATALFLHGQAVAADIPQTPAVANTTDDTNNCTFVTNDCETCVVDATGKPSCSSTGIACVPMAKHCLIRKK
jgi:hypothetical protein